jgi:NADH-quinone oxidoreductase subunit L
VIHALSGEQDMRKMGALRKRIPVTFWTMTAGVFAIAGIYPFAGFFSKDEILYNAFISNNPLGKLLWFVGLVTAGMTSFYMFRLWFKTFFGASHVDEAANAPHGHAAHQNQDEHDEGQASHPHGVHESPWIMLFPLVVLAILSVIGGWVGIPAALGGHNEIEHFLEPVFSTGTHTAEVTASHGLEFGLAVVSLFTAFLGLFAAWFLYIKKPGTSTALAQRAKPLYALLENKFYVDEIYHALIIVPLLVFTRIILFGVVDFGIVDGSGKLAGATTRGLGSLTRRMQSGNIRSYAGWLALGGAAVLAIMIFGRSIWTH